MNKKEFSKNIKNIINLYVNEFESYKDIGDTIGCSPSTIKRTLLKNNIKLRT